MTFGQISHMHEINAVDADKADKIAESIKANGWIGCPVLIWNDQLLTGSHRLAALKKIADEDEACASDIWDMDVAEDVTEIVEEAFKKFEEENGWTPDIDFGNIGWMLEGSWVEKYRDEIVEW